MKWTIEVWKGKEVAVKRDPKGHFRNWGHFTRSTGQRFDYIHIRNKKGHVKKTIRRKKRTVTPPPPPEIGFKYDAKFGIKYKSKNPHQTRYGSLCGTVYSPHRLTNQQIYNLLLNDMSCKLTMTWLDGVKPNREPIMMYVHEFRGQIIYNKPTVVGIRVYNDNKF